MDAEELEPAGGGVGAGGASVAGAEGVSREGDGPRAGADEHEGAGDGADHVVKEAVGLDLDGDAVAVAIDVHGEDGSDAAETVGPVGFEGSEIVPAEQGARGFAHGADVEVRGDVPGDAAKEGVGEGAVVDEVSVALGFGVERGVEGLGDFLGAGDADVGGEGGVEGAEEDLGRVSGGGVEMDDLGEGVDAGVGASAGGDGRGVSEEGFEGLFEDELDGAAVALALPPAEVGAVVTDGELDVAEHVVRA